MPQILSDGLMEASKQMTHGESLAQQRKHNVSCSTSNSLSSFEEKCAVKTSFPTRVDLPHLAIEAIPAQRQQFFERKYLADRCLGGILLVLFSPVIVALYFLVRATSRGPGLYKQERVGLNGKTFDIYKLRSMVQNAEKAGQPQWAVKGDSRVNLVGRVLRKLHLDELPQLYNVVCGDMSLVGPRPERPQICDDLARKINGYYNRTAVKPGVTGLAQINLPPDESIDDVRRKQILDMNYIENAGLWLDTRMVVATALRMVGLKGVAVMRLMRLDRTYLTKEIDASDEHSCSLPARMARSSVRSDEMMDSRGSMSAIVSLSRSGANEDSSRFSYSNHPR